MWTAKIVLAVLLVVLLASCGVSGSDRQQHFTVESVESALNELQHLRQRRCAPVYTENNIYNGFRVPQYDENIHDYVGTRYPSDDADVLDRYSRAMAVLQHAAADGDVNATVTLADYNMFGYVARANYTAALQYYHQVVAMEPNGHCYFMLGLAYSTGLFGELEKDPARGLLYYKFAMENGEQRGVMALAYKSRFGHGVPLNCDLSLHYYDRLAQLGRQHIGEYYQANDIGYNIKVGDFNGGIYGNKLSESPILIYSHVRDHEHILLQLHQNSFEFDLPSYTEVYNDMLATYMGDYFHAANHTKAFEMLYECLEMYKSSDVGFRSMEEQKSFYNCVALRAHMYIFGQGVKKNATRAARTLSQVQQVDQGYAADLAYIYENGLDDSDPDPEAALQLYAAAANKKSHMGQASVGRLLIKHNDRLSSLDVRYAVANLTLAVRGGNTEAWYYLGELQQSYPQTLVKPNNQYQCEAAVRYFKTFAESLDKLFVPELKWAFNEVTCGRYKNALLGYLIGAELGLEHAQVSAAQLLYQLQPLLSKFRFFSTPRTTHTSPRVKSAINYLEQASMQGDIDSTLLLGDLYYYGVEGTDFGPDFSMAFAFYNRAANHHSSHGCYSLAYMYEQGLGPLNNTVDYFLAKRFYDLSLSYMQQQGIHKNSVPVSLALLRLRLKYMLAPRKNRGADTEESYGWLKAFKSISQSQERAPENDHANDRARAHHEGGDFEVEQVYDASDYLVIAITVMFFLVFFIQSLLQMRRLRNRNNNAANNDAANNNEANNNDNNAQQNGWNAQFNFGRGNFEFHFFAI